MPTFALTKDMETGVAKIDEQHRELINRINAVVTMGSQAFSKEETEKTLNLLGEYVVKHFTDEEELQRQCNYPKYEMHKALHQDFVNEFLQMKKEFAEKGNTSKFTVYLTQTVTSWVIKHIKGSDVELGKYYREHMGK